MEGAALLALKMEKGVMIQGMWVSSREAGRVEEWLLPCSLQSKPALQRLEVSLVKDISDFRLSELQENKCVFSKPPSLWSFIIVAMENSYTLQPEKKLPAGQCAKGI